jgi:hypothetical protein
MELGGTEGSALQLRRELQPYYTGCSGILPQPKDTAVRRQQQSGDYAHARLH